MVRHTFVTSYKTKTCTQSMIFQFRIVKIDTKCIYRAYINNIIPYALARTCTYLRRNYHRTDLSQCITCTQTFLKELHSRFQSRTLPVLLHFPTYFMKKKHVSVSDYFYKIVCLEIYIYCIIYM